MKKTKPKAKSQEPKAAPPLLQLTFTKFPKHPIGVFFEKDKLEFQATFGFDKFTAPSVQQLKQKIEKAIKAGATPEPVWIPIIEVEFCTPSKSKWGHGEKREYYGPSVGLDRYWLCQSKGSKRDNKTLHREWKEIKPTDSHVSRGFWDKALQAALQNKLPHLEKGQARNGCVHAFFRHTDEIWDDLVQAAKAFAPAAADDFFAPFKAKPKNSPEPKPKKLTASTQASYRAKARSAANKAKAQSTKSTKSTKSTYLNFDQDDALLDALNISDIPWDDFSNNGVTNDDLMAALREAFKNGYSDSYITVKGGPGPAVWFKGDSKGAPDLKGKELLQTVRNLMECPQPNPFEHRVNGKLISTCTCWPSRRKDQQRTNPHCKFPHAETHNEKDSGTSAAKEGGQSPEGTAPPEKPLGKAMGNGSSSSPENAKEEGVVPAGTRLDDSFKARHATKAAGRRETPTEFQREAIKKVLLEDVFLKSWYENKQPWGYRDEEILSRLRVLFHRRNPDEDNLIFFRGEPSPALWVNDVLEGPPGREARKPKPDLENKDLVLLVRQELGLKDPHLVIPKTKADPNGVEPKAKSQKPKAKVPPIPNGQVPADVVKQLIPSQPNAKIEVSRRQGNSKERLGNVMVTFPGMESERFSIRWLENLLKDSQVAWPAEGPQPKAQSQEPETV